MEKEITIYLLRGLSRESGHWGDFSTNLKQHFHNSSIHYIELPGAGIHFKEKSPASIPKIVDWLHSKNEILGSSNLLIASSLGGMVAMEWAKRYPNDFKYVVTVCSSYKGICTPQERFNLKFVFPIVWSFISFNKKQREKVILSINSNCVNKRAQLLEPWLHIQRKRPLSKINFFRQLIAAFNFKPQLLNPAIRLLIIGSKQDQLVRNSCIEKTHQYLGGTLIWHPTSGHCVPIDEPEWLIETIYDWIIKQDEND